MQTPNKNVTQGMWTEFKGEIQKVWGQITNDEMEQNKGDLTAIRGLIQQRYGKAQQDYSEKFDALVNTFSNVKENIVTKIKQDLKTEEE